MLDSADDCPAQRVVARAVLLKKIRGGGNSPTL